MTVPTTNNRVSYAGNDVTTIFSFPNKFLANADLVVLSVLDSTGAETVKVLTTDYTLTGAGDAAGGSVTMLVAPPTGTTLVIYRDPALTQPIDLVNGGPLDVENIEKGLDRAALQIQRVRDIHDRSLRLPDGDTGFVAADAVLPSAVNRASKFMAFTATGAVTATAGIAGTVVVSPFMETVVDDATAAALVETIRTDLVEETAPATDDEIILRDTSALAGKRMPLANVLTVVNALTAETAPDAADQMLLYDTSGADANKVSLSVLAEALRVLSVARDVGAARNYSISESRAAGATTFTLAAADGSALSATNKAQFVFRSVTPGVGTTDVVDASANLTFTFSSGSTVGATNAIPFRIWLVLFNDAGTLRLGAINCSTGTRIYPLADDTLASAVAEGGAGAADSAGVVYAGAAVSAKPMRVLGYAEFTLAAVGTWDTAASKIQSWQPGMKLPGDTVQTALTVDSAYATTSAILPQDDTIPQITEGAQFMSVGITPTSAINHLHLRAQASFGGASVSINAGHALFQGAVADALCYALGGVVVGSVANMGSDIVIAHFMRAGTVFATTFSYRAGPPTASPIYFNGVNGVRVGGGVCYSHMTAIELMA